MFLLLAGGLLIILFAVIVAVVSSVVSAVAADTDDTEDKKGKAVFLRLSCRKRGNRRSPSVSFFR